MRQERVSTSGRARAALAIRLLGGGVAVGSMLAIVGSVGTGVAYAEQQVHKSYVCKYVSKPGQAERLQTGQNPIWVDNHSLLGYDGTVTVGQQFKDGQIRSVVIVANTPKLNPEPGIDQCAAPKPPTTPTPTPTPTPTRRHAQATPTPPQHVTPAQHPTAKAGAEAAATYPLQPVKGGMTSEQASDDAVVTPSRAALVLLGLLALWFAVSGRVPWVKRVKPSRDDR
jgi:hypothetical protein